MNMLEDYPDILTTKEVMEILSANQLEIKEYTETHFRGSITTTADKPTVLTTIPYDEGWVVKVDGKPVEIEKALEGVICFDIERVGYHTVDIEYAPRIVQLGTLISLVSVGVFGLVLLVDLLVHRKKRKKESR